ncbi:mediator of RNA polymerase II transcription subunit 19-like isoform X1 [Crassostrea angulata]|nr:mediator of RNA polymerase II transcription subunit 19-like isoform X1 [Crassostrea gigas]XP_052713227.1 mediator of RNA polymerase II transcription subunit 19-like isoform X1 [Crassostrea angulata]|eukprot:XP_011426120.1 PREDICTED: mediator of RNA polymerase II transcription subunit 19-like [Crassostrea gigas]
MNEPIRRPEQGSPRSSPRGSRSPAYPRTDSSGTLKTTISLGRVPSVIHSGPFYLVKDIGPAHPSHSGITGSTNLMIHYGLQNSYSKFCKKEGKEELSAFLPNLPGYIDTPGMQDNSSLRSLIENPPKTSKELVPLSGPALQGFRLHPGPLPEQYRFMSHMPRKKHKLKKKEREREKPGNMQDAQDNSPEVKTKKVKTEEKKKKKKKNKKKAKEKDDGSLFISIPPT